MKRNKILSHAINTCYNTDNPLKTFEVTETRHKRPYIVQFPLYKMFRIGKYIESLGVEGGGGVQRVTIMDMGFLFGIMKMF